MAESPIASWLTPSFIKVLLISSKN